MTRFLSAFTSLKAKIIGTALAALIISNVAVLAGGAITLREASTDQVAVNLSAAFANSKSSLLSFHRDRWRALEGTSTEISRLLSAEEPDTRALSDQLLGRKMAFEYFSELFVVDLKGTVLASTETARIGSVETRRVALRGIEDGGTRFLDGPYWDDLTEKIGATSSSFHDGVTLMYALPLRQGERQLGILMARLPNDVQSDVLQRDDAHIYKESGDTYLFMVESTTGVRPGVALSRSRFEDATVTPGANLKEGIDTAEWGTISVERATELELAFRDPETGLLTEGVRDIIDQGEANSSGPVGYPDYRHVPVVGVGGTIQVPGSPDEWGLISEANVDEAYAAVWNSATFAARIAGATLLLVSIAFSIVVLRPMGTLRKFMGEIRSTSDSVRDTSSALGRSANSLSTSASDQAAAIAETMASMEEITAMVSSNSDSANEALSISQTASHSAAHGSEVVAEMGKTMRSIADQNGELARVVEIIENISDKTKIINDIVFETKLLSFNASIEAARAGNQGKGFAVVAEEVGNLAHLSGKAAQEIHALIEQSTKQVQNMVSVTKESISEGLNVTERCREAFDSINDGVSKVASMMDAIALSSSEQQQGISQVSKAMAQMDSLTQNTAVAAADAASQSDGLRQAGDKLRSVVLSLHGLIDGSEGAKAAGTAVAAPANAEHETADKSDLDDIFADADRYGVNDSEYGPEAAGMAETPDLDDVAFK
ncbi:MAG: methyl-accepting chemotaxis protein [Nannocystaceae bacterium]